MPRLSRNAIVIGSVLLLHGAGLWALQSGLLQRAAEVFVPAQIIADFIRPAPPAPEPAPPQPPPQVQQPQRAEPVKPRVRPAPRRQPVPEVVQQPQPPSEPSENAPVVEVAAQEPVEVAAAEPAPAVATSAPPADAVQLPSENAQYLNNPRPPYPHQSRRLGERGTVIVRVLIGENGRARQASIHKSSGYDRLDRVALETARDRWRYRPGTRNGVPEAMWFNVPIKFELE
ncbi:MAG: energy transducer TonB [Burkholderiaceae bacterium]|nr:energy transducer TonB [Burkholderiaceae bacterium]